MFKNNSSVKIKSLVILAVIIVLGTFLRFYKLASFPVQLGHDEVSQLYDAISIAQTGKDMYGSPYPIIFKSVNDYKPPFYTYATVVMYKIFGWQDVTIRITGALFGTLVILGVYLFVNSFLKNKGVALTAAALTAISPFEIFYSRKSFENQAGVFLSLLGFALIAIYLKKKRIRFFYWGTVVLGLSAYVYFAQAVLVPILLVVFIVLFWKKFRPLKIWPLVMFLVVITPLFYIIITNPDARNRSSAVFITQDFRLGRQLVGKNGLTRLMTIGRYSAIRYVKQFDPKYLFLEGLSLTDGRYDLGPLFAVQIPFLLAGIYLLYKNRELKREKLFVLAWILVSMIPSGITFEDYSPHRAIAVFTMLNIVSAYGVFWFFKRFGKISLVILLILFGANLAFFIKRYTINFPIEKSEALEYPFRDVSLFAWQNYDKYDQIVFDPKFGEYAPWIGTGAQYFLAYYGHYPPAKMQSEFKIGDQTKRETKFDKFSIRAVFWPADSHLKNTLIIASPWSLPSDIAKRANIIKTFYFKTTAPAFYAIAM